MPDQQIVPVSASEQNAVLKDLRTWFRANIDWFNGKKLTISSLDLVENNVSIVPIKGVRKRKQYACGGYQVFFPFSLYYRTSVEGNVAVENVFDDIDAIGFSLDSIDYSNMLSGDRTVDNFYQDTTTTLLAKKGNVTDFVATFVLIYSV